MRHEGWGLPVLGKEYLVKLEDLLKQVVVTYSIQQDERQKTGYQTNSVSLTTPLLISGQVEILNLQGRRSVRIWIQQVLNLKLNCQPPRVATNVTPLSGTLKQTGDWQQLNFKSQSTSSDSKVTWLRHWGLRLKQLMKNPQVRLAVVSHPR